MPTYTFLCVVFIIYCNIFVDIVSIQEKNYIIKFICDGCMPSPYECCVGIALSSRRVLTSNYCAKTCHSVEKDKTKIPIIQIQDYPNPKTFVFTYGFTGPDTIALVELEYNTNKYFYNISDLFSIDTALQIGMRVTFPLLNSKSIFRENIIKHCDKNSAFLKNYYICSSDEDYDNYDIPLGTPLFLKNQLIAIKGLQDSKFHKYSERVFLSLNPMVFWIKYHQRNNQLENGRRLLATTNNKNNKQSRMMKIITIKKIEMKQKVLASKQINLKRKWQTTSNNNLTQVQRKILPMNLKKPKQNNKKTYLMKSSHKIKLTKSKTSKISNSSNCYEEVIRMRVKRICSRPNVDSTNRLPLTKTKHSKPKKIPAITIATVPTPSTLKKRLSIRSTIKNNLQSILTTVKFPLIGTDKKYSFTTISNKTTITTLTASTAIIQNLKSVSNIKSLKYPTTFKSNFAIHELLTSAFTALRERTTSSYIVRFLNKTKTDTTRNTATSEKLISLLDINNLVRSTSVMYSIYNKQKSTVSSNVINTIKPTKVTVNDENNAMEWFKNVKSKLKSNYTSLLILTVPTKRTLDFVDLT